jgi:hypothetical protein
MLENRESHPRIPGRISAFWVIPLERTTCDQFQSALGRFELIRLELLFLYLEDYQANTLSIKKLITALKEPYGAYSPNVVFFSETV